VNESLTFAIGEVNLELENQRWITRICMPGYTFHEVLTAGSLSRSPHGWVHGVLVEVIAEHAP